MRIPYVTEEDMDTHGYAFLGNGKFCDSHASANDLMKQVTYCRPRADDFLVNQTNLV